MLEDEGIKIAIPLESIESYTVHVLTETSMCRIQFHTYGGELDEVSFALPWNASSPDRMKRMELIDQYRAIRKEKMKDVEVPSAGLGLWKDRVNMKELPPIVMQLGSSTNWILPNTVRGGEVRSGKPTPEVLLKAVFAIPSSETLWSEFPFFLF